MKFFHAFLTISWLSYGYAKTSVDDSVALENYLDGIIEARMRDKHIAGATLSVVKNGRIFL